MNSIVRFFRSRGFLFGLLFVLAVALIFVLGRTFAWPMTVQLLLLIVLLIVCVAVLALQAMRASRAATGIEKSLRKQAERQRAAGASDAETEQLQKQLERSIETLKRSKLAGTGLFRSGKTALYALPWYMFIGPPGSGKTTAIANSGLQFPVGLERVRGVGGTRNCDWFFTDSAILLDTAGRYVTEAQDQTEWFAFLDTLKKHRKAQPINGVIVGIGLDELLNASPGEVLWHAETLRQRIDELVSRLGVLFPVYLVFTKADLLRGFVEFFGDLSRQERDQIWGATFDPGALGEQSLHSQFLGEFDLLVDTLQGARVEQMRKPQKREERHKAYVFPMEFGGVRDTLGRFVETLFQTNPFQETPLFRGFYFTSGTQEGVPIDRVIQSIAQQFNLPAPAGGPTQPAVEAKSYFIKDVFTKVIIPDQYLVKRTSRAALRQGVATAGIGVGALVVLVLMLLGISQGLVRSGIDVGRVEAVATEAGAVRWDEPTRYPAHFAALDSLRLTLSAYDGVPFSQLGLHRRGTVLEPAEALYLDRLHAFARPQLVDRMQRRLGRARGVVESGLEREYLHETLKAYLLLSEESARLEDGANEQFLAGFLASEARALLRERDSLSVTPQVSDHLATHMEAYAQALANGTLLPYTVSGDLVAQARRAITAAPSIGSVYSALRQEALYSLDPLTLQDDVVSREHAALFARGSEVPGFFTQEGRDFAERRFSEESADPSRDDWVLGQENMALPESMLDSDRMKAELYERYYDDYAAAWERFLRSVRYENLEGLRSASQHLLTLGSPSNSPLVQVLAEVTRQTTIEEDPLSQLGTEAVRAAERLERRARSEASRRTSRIIDPNTGQPVEEPEEDFPNPVMRRFAALHALGAPGVARGQGSAQLSQALAGFEEISGLTEEVGGDPAAAADVARSVLDANGGAFGDVMRSVSTGLRQLDPDVRRSLFERPLLDAWSALLGLAQQHLNNRWRDEVYRPYEATLAGRYPLDPTGREDAPLYDFETYFNPDGGTFAVFREEVLTPYLTDDGRRVRTWEGRGIGVSSTTFGAIEQAETIGDDLFRGGMQVEFEMRPDVPTYDGNAPPADGIYLNVQGQRLEYRMGSVRPWTSFVWPGSSPGAELTVASRGQQFDKTYEGDWALFRLLADARMEARGSTQFQTRWSFSEGGTFVINVPFDLRTRSSVSPLRSPARFFRFRLPPTLG
ncbi:MAG: type VI secretion system membrane subunit TssM [Bacteroidota bacterium]